MSIRDYIEHLRDKPIHIRKQVALGVSSGLTALVLVGWVAALVSSDRLAFTNDEQGSDLSGAAEEARDGFSDLAGAAAALDFEDAGTMTVVDTKASSTLDTYDTGDATVIPF